MYEKFASFVAGMFDTRNLRIAIAALILASALIAGCTTILSIDFGGGVIRFDIPEGARIFLLVSYPLSFFVIWFLMYVQNRKDAEDIYSKIRDRIKGSWLVQYEAHIGPISGKKIVEDRVIGCNITVSPTDYKLELRFDIFNNPIFSDQEGNIIKEVTIRYDENGKYVMIYYFSAIRTIKSDISVDIIPESGSSNSAELEVNIFGRVVFDRPAADGVITDMSGRWYDLNGNVCRLLAFLEEREKKEGFEPMKLSDVPMNQRYFDADMGAVRFRRG